MPPVDFSQNISVQAGDAGAMDITPPFVVDYNTMAAVLTGSGNAGDRCWVEKASANVCRVRWSVTDARNVLFTVNSANSLNGGDFQTAPSQAPAGTPTPGIQTEDP